MLFYNSYFLLVINKSKIKYFLTIIILCIKKIELKVQLKYQSGAIKVEVRQPLII